MERPEERYKVDFIVHLSWQEGATLRRVQARCKDLSDSGARIELRDPIQVRGLVLVSSEQFGRMGTASVRYCRREGMKYGAGLEFTTALALGNPARRQIVERILSRE